MEEARAKRHCVQCVMKEMQNRCMARHICDHKGTYVTSKQAVFL